MVLVYGISVISQGMQRLMPSPFFWLSVGSVAFYLAGTYLALRTFQTNEPTNRIIRTGSGIVAVTLHGTSVIVAIDAATDLSLGLTLMLACVGFAMATVLVLNQLRKAASHLEVFVFPLSALSLVLFGLLPNTGLVRLDIPTPLFVHIVLALLAYSVLALAALQALYLASFDRLVKSGNRLPADLSLNTIEETLFESIWLGMIALTLGIISGFVFIDGYDTRGMLHHTIITAAAWATFAVLLWGRVKAGWRGSQAGQWTLFGFALLAIGYFGSKFVIEVLV